MIIFYNDNTDNLFYNDNTANLRGNQIAPHSPTRLIGDPALAPHSPMRLIGDPALPATLWGLN